MRQILHVDMDAFYASIEQRDRPELKGQPVIVGADPKEGRGRGVVAACSYEARKFGVRSALPISQAWRRCPQGVYLRPRFERYREVSDGIMTIFRRYTEMVEPLSIDEAFLDVSGSMAALGTAPRIARRIKSDILADTGLTASVGVAANKFLAKIASDLDKPDGLVVVPEDDARAFLAPLPISRLWGVGPKTARRLHKLGIRTIGDLAKMPSDRLTRALGSAGEHLWRLAQGEDDRPVVAYGEPKSISNETTFPEDTRDPDHMVGTLRFLADHVAARLRQKQYRARTVTLKLRYASFETHTRQTALAEPTDDGDEIFRRVRRLFEAFPLDQPIRLLGVGTSNFARTGQVPAQLKLFRLETGSSSLAGAMDEIHARFGPDVLHRGRKLS